jgi:hypothetical protein
MERAPLKVPQRENPTTHAIRILEGGRGCLLQSGTAFTPLIAELGEVSLRTAHRDSLYASKHFIALAAILTAKAENTPSEPANDLQSLSFEWRDDARACR